MSKAGRSSFCGPCNLLGWEELFKSKKYTHYFWKLNENKTMCTHPQDPFQGVGKDPPSEKGRMCVCVCVQVREGAGQASGIKGCPGGDLLRGSTGGNLQAQETSPMVRNKEKTSNSFINK